MGGLTLTSTAVRSPSNFYKKNEVGVDEYKDECRERKFTSPSLSSASILFRLPIISVLMSSNLKERNGKDFYETKTINHRLYAGF